MLLTTFWIGLNADDPKLKPLGYLFFLEDLFKFFYLLVVVNPSRVYGYAVHRSESDVRTRTYK